MKSLLMSLTLFIAATSASAESTDYQSLEELYRAHTDTFEVQRSLPNHVYEEEFIFLKLIQIQDNNRHIKTIKANLTIRQRLFEVIA